jgi:TonB family protein
MTTSALDNMQDLDVPISGTERGPLVPRAATPRLAASPRALSVVAAVLSVHCGLLLVLNALESAPVKPDAFQEIPVDLVSEWDAEKKTEPPKADEAEAARKAQEEAAKAEKAKQEKAQQEAAEKAEKAKEAEKAAEAEKAKQAQKDAEKALEAQKAQEAEKAKEAEKAQQAEKAKEAEPPKPEPKMAEAPKTEAAKPEPPKAEPPKPEPPKTEPPKPQPPKQAAAPPEKKLAPRAEKPNPRAAKAPKPLTQTAEAKLQPPPAPPQQANVPPSQSDATRPAAPRFDPLPDSFRAVSETANGVALPAATDDGEIQVTYTQLVFSQLELAKHYPESAKQHGVQGQAGIGFTLDESGNVLDVELLVPTGDPDLDAESVALVRRAAPFPHPPPGARLRFTAVVSFYERPAPPKEDQ